MSFGLYRWSELDEDDRRELLRRPSLSQDPDITAAAADIIAEVRSNGDEALRRLALRYDGAKLADIRVDTREREAAERSLTAAQRDAIDLAIGNVRRFHEAQVNAPICVETMPGVFCERISHPIDSAGLYVPAGTAPLPSAAIMLAVPAAIAGCETCVLCTPPRPDGLAHPAVVAAASRAGITDIFKVGGAQAIAAMAYGTETLPRVTKIFGPGNAWVTAAKALVSGDPGGAAIDLPAGPSEVLVIGDASASAEFVAADLLSQAEHGVDSQVLFVTDCELLADAVRTETQRQLAGLPRRDIAAQAIANSRIVIVDTIAAAIDVSNQYAPEHLILQIAEARSYLNKIRNAGSVFVGRWTPESVGDYCSGTNHVLPTYGYGKAYSGLGVDQFMRQMTVQELTRDGLGKLGDAVVSLARLEGLDAHAAAVTRRLAAEQ